MSEGKSGEYLILCQHHWATDWSPNLPLANKNGLNHNYIFLLLIAQNIPMYDRMDNILQEKLSFQSSLDYTWWLIPT